MLRTAYRVWFDNHEYFSQREFTTEAEAIAFAKSTTFDSTIYLASRAVAHVSFFGGTKDLKGRAL